MPFTVEDLNDLLALLEKHPEWKERLRQVLLTEDLLRLPSAVNRLIASVDRLTEAVERLNQWQQQTNEQIRQLLDWQRETTQWQKQVNEQLNQLIEWQRETIQWQRQVNEQLKQLLEWQQEMIQWQRETTQWQKQVNEQLRQLLEWQQEMIQWQRETTQWQQQVNEQLNRLIEWQRRADERFDRIERDLAKLKGSDREMYYILRAPAVFGIFVCKGRDPRNEVMERLHDAVRKGIITRKELKALRDADYLWLGEYDGKEVLLVIEVSYTVSLEDLIRAVQRAEIARQLGYNAVPIVAGSEVPDEIWEQARNFNVIVMSDGETDLDFAEQVFRRATGLESHQAS